MATNLNNSDSKDREILSGIVLRVTYYNRENGYTVLKAQPSSGSKKEIAIVGRSHNELTPGVNIVATGKWITHPKFGIQFDAKTINESLPTSKNAIIKYLSSGQIKGIGPVNAEKIVEHFGEEALRVIDEDPNRLYEVDGLGEKKIGQILEQWSEKKNSREIILFFENHNLPATLGLRLYRHYKDRAIDVIKQNPYILTKDIWGIGFLTADKIAKATGITEDAPIRIKAGLEYALKKSIDEGNCFLPQDILAAKSGILLGIGDEELIRNQLNEAFEEESLINDNGKIYLPQFYSYEKILGSEISERLCPLVDSRLSEAQLERSINTPIFTTNADGSQKAIKLSAEQAEALKLVSKFPLTVITGGPGCGKTTVIQSIYRLFNQSGLETRLAAPTGKAAQRLAEVCGEKATTIHRLLGYDPMKKGFIYDENNRLPIDALIVDETSMIDLPLATSLFRALDINTRVVLVGDIDQLPSVGPGLILSDLLSLSKIAKIRLTKLFRRAEESLISIIAHDINHGIAPEIPEPDGKTKTDAYFINAKNPGDLANLVEKLFTTQIPKHFGFKSDQITVLSPMNLGEIGTAALNQKIQNSVLPATEFTPRVKIGDSEIRLGDRVIQRVNNYQIHENGVFNGDQGIVTGIDAAARSINVKLWDDRIITYSGEDLSQLDLAYCLTVHRSQGTEIPAVILILHDSHTIMLERQLIYTGITRAKKLLILVGTKSALKIAAKKTRGMKRYTGLVDRIN